ncbi:VWA domain-containing protein [Gammaproteobacteria bacterium]|nr:VWA domain-containing protein [Gammaproteobacteria bacterium]
MKHLKLKPTLLSVLIAGVVLTACNSGQESVVENAGAIPTQLPLIDSEPSGRVNENQQRVIQEAAISESREAEMDLEIAVMSPPVMMPGTRIGISQDLMYLPEAGTENYAEFDDSGIQIVIENAVSTFSIDVDTGAYSNVRRMLNQGYLPPADAVRAEELINYFSYNYPITDSNVPFSVMTEVSTSPWNTGKHLLHIGIKANEPTSTDELHTNLVFLVDVSGSMASPDKLDLLKNSLKMLSRQLSAQDSVSLVVYAGASGVVLEPTAGNETREISAALDRLQAGGSTNGAAGIQLAYAMAEQAFIEDGINRVILATDGDFNVGMSSVDALKDLIEEKRESGISLTTLGFGTGNYNDHMMEQLADAGNGNYAYIDNINEARKVLVDEMSSTLQTVAKDVKIQIEFNPSVVAEYRLVGYENRELAREDFNNDQVDAGEIGAGHTVTAIYEIALLGSESLSMDPLRYNQESAVGSGNVDELGFLKLRYKEPDSDESILLERALLASDISEDFTNTSDNYRFSAAVAGLAQLLRGSDQAGTLDYDTVINLAQSAKGEDEFGYRSEFIQLVRSAQALSLN